ncbi:MAG: hypothetical protein ACYSW7_03275 [Planctomycetota bacterium]|jgi:hypothetical protein
MQEINQDKNKPDRVAESKKKILIFVVCYKAEKSVGAILHRIPKGIWGNKRFYTEILIIDDQSPDRTFYTAEEYSRQHPERHLPKTRAMGVIRKSAIATQLRRASTSSSCCTGTASMHLSISNR